MKYIIGRKIEMKQQYADNGMVVPFTLVKAGPCIVTQVKTTEKDGYNAIQFGFGSKKNIVKPQQGHLIGLIEKAGRGFACMKELRLQKPAEGVMRGDSVGVNSFVVGDVVDVTGWGEESRPALAQLQRQEAVGEQHVEHAGVGELPVLSQEVVEMGGAAAPVAEDEKWRLDVG